MATEIDNSRLLAERRVKLINGIAGNDEKAKRIKYSMYSRFGDLAQAIYSDPVKEGLIRGNTNAFTVLCDKTVYAWAFTGRSHSEEFMKATAKYPEMQRLFSTIQELQKGINKISEITGASKSNISFEDFVTGLSSFKADSIVPLMDDMGATEEDDFVDTGYFEEDEESTEHIIGTANADAIDANTLNRQIAEAEEDLASGELDSDAEQAVKSLISELKLLKIDAVSGPKDVMEIKDEYAGDLAEGISILKDAGACFEFTKKEIRALDKAFADAGYNIRADEDSELTNFVAVHRADFSATFIFSTLGLIESKRQRFKQVFIAYTGYATFGEIDPAPYGRQDWWAIECITNNRKFTVAEWPGIELSQYKELGNLKKIWVGTSLREKHLTMDWLDAQNSFNLIGGKSRSGKTCLSHSLLIQGICGGILPTFLDWKPEGSDLYKGLGFYAVQRDARAWLPQGMAQGLHLMNIMEALAWLKSMSYVWSNREIAGKRDFDRNKMATQEDPSLLFVFDEIAAFISTIGTMRVTKKEKDMTPQERATKTVTDYAEIVFKGLNGCLAACATYGVKFMGITQDIMMSDTVWHDKAWGGDEGKNFRKKMLNTFWGRGTVRGIDCPVTEIKERSYVNMGMGRFGFEQNGVPKTFRALRIDNSVNEGFPGMDAAAVLNACLNSVGKSLPDIRHSYYDALINSVRSAPDFMAVLSAINEGFGGASASTDNDNDYNTGAFANEFKSVDTSSKAKNDDNKQYKHSGDAQSYGSPTYVNPAVRKIAFDKQLEVEKIAREALEREDLGNENNINKDNETDNNIPISDDDDIFKAVDDGYMSAAEAFKVIVEKRSQQASDMTGKDGRRVVFDTNQYKSYSKLDANNSIDCRKSGPGPLTWIEKMTFDTPAGAQKYITKIWGSILDNVIACGYKKANITRVSIYGGQMYVNGKILNLNGVIGGHECIRLKDIVYFRVLFNKFFMVRELRIDEEMLRVAVMEFGENTIEKMFSLAPKLESVFVQSENGETNSFDRSNVQSQSAKRVISKSKEANDMDLYCANKSAKNWSTNLAGDNIWGMRLAKKSLGSAGQMFMDKNKPSIGKAAIYAGTGLLVGTIGSVAWGTAKLVGSIFKLGSMFNNNH